MSLSFPSAFTLSVLIIGLWDTTSRADEASVCRARMHPAYQVFAAQTRLPEIKTLDSGVLAMGGTLKLDLRRPDRLTTRDKAAVAQLFQVPTGLLTNLIHTLSTNQQPSGEEVIKEFQTAVIDYRYLAHRWASYRPPAGAEAVKAEAVKCLETGDLARVWQLYIDLPKPSPPKGLHIASAAPGKN